MGKFSQLAAASNDQPTKEPSSQRASQPTSRGADQPITQPAVESAGDRLIDAIRQGIKEEGSRSGTHTFTDAEREWLEDLVHSMRRQGFRDISGNKVIRILLHAARYEREELGENSLIERAVRTLF